MKPAVIILAALLLAGTPARSERTCTVDQVYADPIGRIGCTIEVRGMVRKMLSLSLPIEFIIESEGALFIVQCFQVGGSRVAIKEGRAHAAKGTVLGSKKVLYDGSLVELPLVLSMEPE